MFHDFEVPIPDSRSPEASTDAARSQGDGFAAQDPRAVAILGGGNIGQALALGWARSTARAPAEITITRRRTDLLSDLAGQGFRVESDNLAAVRRAKVVVLAVQPQQLDPLLAEIRSALRPERHALVSVVSGVRIAQIRDRLGMPIPIIRAMPNTGLTIRESMTCLSTDAESHDVFIHVRPLFEAVGKTLVIQEELAESATALCACGIAFFLRAIRAASQGGVEVGFHPDEAMFLAAQTARGAAALMLDRRAHPEAEIDRVTTPRGCTIAGLNEMEHRGFSSAFIKAILVSAEKAARLYDQ